MRRFAPRGRARGGKPQAILRLMRTALLLAIAGGVAIALLGACGQKGPLVLPDAQHPHRKIGMPKPAPPAAPAEGGGGAAPANSNDPGAPNPTPAPQQ